MLPAGSPTVTAVSPDPLLEGEQATLAGENFGPDPSQNRVVIDGGEATVQSASRTELVVTVPTYDCLPARTVGLQVTVGEQTSPAVEHPLEPPGDPVSLGVGEQAVLHDPADHCLQFAATGAAEAYLVGVQSVSEADGLTTVSLAAETGAGPAASEPLSAPAPTVGRAVRTTRPPIEPTVRWREHVRAEARLRAADRAAIERLPRTAALTGRAAAARASVPSGVTEGDTVQIRVPDGSCSDFAAVDAEVRVVGEHGIWITDVENPDGGYTDAELQGFSDQFDASIFPVEEDYFGTPTDTDGNGAGVFVVTKEVNRRGGILGFVSLVDQFERDACAASDEGELTYLVAPDPNGEFDDPHQKSDLLADAPSLVTHEFTHMIQLGRRFEADDPVPESWILEGQATFAEEVVGHEITGRTTDQNYGVEVALNREDEDETDWYVGRFSHLGRYYGFESRSSRVSGAPEECTWLVRGWGQGSCLRGDLSVYGPPSILLRWIADHFGPETSGGEQALHRAIVDGPATGYALLEEVTGEPIGTLLARWAATLYVDDRVPGAEERLTLPSWDLFDIFTNGFVETARLAPRERGFVDFDDAFSVNGGSSAYYRISGDGRPTTALRARSGAGGTLGAHMQVWIVRIQ